MPATFSPAQPTTHSHLNHDDKYRRRRMAHDVGQPFRSWTIAELNRDSCSTVRVPFASPNHASIAKQVIEVDKELQPHAVKRVLQVEDDVLVACVHACSA